MEYNKILVICIDRDADIFRKIGENGPVYGREKLLDVALRLGLADPSESDTNALFEAVKVGDYFKKEGKEVEVVALVGSENLGVESDTKISKQLDEALEKHKPDGVIVVTDGAEDEYVLPVVQSKANVIAVKRVIVKQAEKLESTYYVIQDFLRDVVSDPRIAKLVLGLPGIVLILYMLLGATSWRLIAGTAGVFLLIKGFGLEGAVQKVFDEFKSSIVTGKISFFTYVVSILVAIVGIAVGYDEVTGRHLSFHNLREAAPVFLSGAISFLSFAAIVALIGKSIDAVLEKHGAWKYMIMMVFAVAVGAIINAASQFLLGRISSIDLAMWVTFGLVLSMLGFLYIRSKWKASRVARAA